MVKWCHRTIELVIKKCMESQQDWAKLLESVLFGMHSQVHCSTGFSPMCMLYNKDPLMPFQVAAQLEPYYKLEENDSSKDVGTENDGGIVESPITREMNNELIDTVQQLEKQRQEIFGNAKVKIQKAQEHQGKCYNNRQNKGKPFEVGSKVLKYDFHQLGKLNKLKSKYLGPYTICGHSSAGNSYYLSDRHSNPLKKPVPASHLVHFYDKKGSYCKRTDDCNYDDTLSSSDIDYLSDEKNNCNRAKIYRPSESKIPHTSTPIKPQIVIMSSKEMPVSSDESETINVGHEMALGKVFGDLNVDDIPIQIVDDLMNSTEQDSDDTIIMTDGAQPVDVCFNPLNDLYRCAAALKFSLVISGATHPVVNIGVCMIMKTPPTVTIKACANGGCLINTFALLLCGRDTYSTIIQHVICNYIDNPVKQGFIQAFLPDNYATGKQYTVGKLMHNFPTWGTEVDIIAFAQIT